MSLNKYRFIDLLIFTTVAAIIDIVVGLNGFFGIQLFFSIGVPIVLVLYIRWGKYALIPNLVVVIIHFIVHYVNLPVMIAHSMGLMSLSFALVIIRWEKLKKINIEFHFIFLYIVLLYLVMVFVEWFFYLIFNQDTSLLGHLINHSLNLFLSIGLLYLMSRQNVLIVNMTIYLRNKVEGE